MHIKTVLNRSVLVLSLAMFGAAGCTDSSSGGHAMGYHDTPPTVTPSNANAPGTPTVNDPSNQLPPGGMTVPPPAQTTPDGARPSEPSH
jgi:hypothetical protein